MRTVGLNRAPNQKFHLPRSSQNVHPSPTTILSSLQTRTASTTMPLLVALMQSKISANFRGMLCINCKMTTAMQILQWLHTSATTLRRNKSTDVQIIATFFRLVWDPSKEPLESFNGCYQELFTQVKDTDKTFPFDRAIDTWINAMPDEFIDLKIKYKKNQLDEV